MQSPYILQHRRTNTMATIKLTVIPEPKPGTASILSPTVSPAIRSEGDMNYDCGSCGTRLLESVTYKQVMNMAIKCPKCSAHNEIPKTHYLQ